MELLVRDGAVLTDKSVVRAGAGMAFRPLTSLARGTPVHVRGTYGDWLKISPPIGMTFWVLREQVEPLAGWPQDSAEPKMPDGLYSALIDALNQGLAQPPAPIGPGKTESPSTPAPSVLDIPPPPELTGFVLDHTAVQGERVTVCGTLDWGGADPVSAPFRLVIREPDGDAVALCNLLAPETTYGSCVGCEAAVEGTRWIVKGTHLPFVIPLTVRLSRQSFF